MSNYMPNVEDLAKTDFRNPGFEKKNWKHIFLLILLLVMLAVVFIPWFCIGLGVEEYGSVQLRTFGFQTWYGITGGVLAIVAVFGVFYRHLSLSLCSSLVGIAIGIFALNTYPDARLVVDLEGELEREVEEVAAPKPSIADFLSGEPGSLDRYSDYDHYYYSDHDNDYYGEWEYDRSILDPYSARMLSRFMELPKLKVPGVLVGVAATVVEMADQTMVYELVGQELGEDSMDQIDVTNHRLGAVLFLILSILASLVSYVAIYSNRNN